MDISKINAAQSVNFQGKARPAKKANSTDTKETVKKVAKVVIGLSAATLATIAIIKGAKKLKALKAPKETFVPGNWKPKKNIGSEAEAANRSFSHAINVIRTADINNEIARVERNVANHDIRQKELEMVFSSSDFVNNVVTSRASLDVDKAAKEAAEITKQLAKK